MTTYQRVMIVEGDANHTNLMDIMSIKRAHRVQIEEADIILVRRLQQYRKTGLLTEKYVAVKDRHQATDRVVSHEEVEEIKRNASTLTVVTPKVSF